MRILAPALALTLLAAAANAQTSTPAAPPTAPASTVSGVTVEGRKTPPSGCSSRDQACIAAVVAELKLRYPKELQQWCDHVEERAAMNEMLYDNVDPDHPHPPVSPFRAPEVTKVACAKIPKK